MAGAYRHVSSGRWGLGWCGDGVADGDFGQCVMPRLSCCVSGGGLYYIVRSDVMGPLSTLLLSSTRALFAERMYPADSAARPTK